MSTWIYQPLLPAAADLQSAVVGTTGQIKVWDGAQWIAKPMKVWDGSTWQIKPVKYWNGTAWITTPF
jgi:hypothetical protein